VRSGIVKEAYVDRPASSSDSISACIVVRNEEAVIDRCLRSLDGVVDEIVLVHDGECEDRTLEIAERHGCRIFVRPLVGHAEVSTVFAYEQAQGEWILMLDADEYLSEPLRSELRTLAADESVNGYEFLWPIWNGGRYVSERGPFRRSLFRRSSVHVLGMIHSVERVDPPVRRLMLALEHRPLYNNYALRTMLSKQRRWARINAREFVGELSDLPSFNWDGSLSWPLRRRLLNCLSPILFIPYFPLVLVVSLLRAAPYAGPRVNLRLAFSQAIYASMVQFYVAKYLYVGIDERDRRVANEPPRPSSTQRAP
jgi:glycosyltransferase involved in cell wall biosynthesis